MAAFARTELDLRRPRRDRTTRRRSSCSSIRDGKMIGRDVFLLDARARGDRRRGRSTSFLEQYYARATLDPARGLRARRARRRPRTSRRSSPSGAAGRSTSASPQRGEKRELHGARHAQRRRDARARAGPLAGRPGQDARPRSRSSPRRSGSPGAAAADRVLRHQQLPGQRVGRRAWSSSRTASRAPASTAGSGSGRSRARTTSPATRRSCGAGSGTAEAGEEGSEEERRWAMPDLVHHRRRHAARSSAAKAVLDELGLHDLAARRPGQGARGAVPARPRRPDRACRRRHRRSTSSSACATRRTGSRSPITATCGRSGPIRSAFDDLPGVGPKRQARAAQGVRLDQARARGAGRADRRRAGHRPGAGGADQGDPRGLTSAPAASGGVPCTIPPVCVEPVPSSSSSSASSPSSSTSSRASPLPDCRERRRARARSRRSWASTCPAAFGSSTRRSRSTASRRPPADMAIIKDIVERRVNTDRRLRAGRRHPGRRPRRRRAAGRHRPRRGPPARRPDRPPRLRPARPDDQATRGPGPRPASTFPPLFSGDQVSVGVDRHGPERRPDGRLRAQGRRRQAVRRLHRRSTSATTSRSPSTATVISAPVIKNAIPNGNVQITAGGIGGFPAKEANEPRHGPEVRLAAVPDQRALERARSARRWATSSSARACSPALHRHRAGHHVHAHLLPAAGRGRELRARSTTRSSCVAIFRLDPGDADARRHRGLRALGRHGGRRQHPDLRADEGGAARRQVARRPRSRPASTGPGTRSSTRTCRASITADDPVRLRVVDDPRLRARPDHRRPRLDVQRDRRDPHDPALASSARTGPAGRRCTACATDEFVARGADPAVVRREARERV